MVTRRCSERRFLMRPDADTNNAFVYCLAVAAQRTEVQVVFFLAMSNHYHAGVVDSAGRLPEFLEYFHKLFAKHRNVLRGRWENFWASEQTSVVELVGQDDVLDKMVYTLTNPVKAHLVERSATWPGASSLSAQLHGHQIRAFRPRRFFRPDGPMPDEVVLNLAPPPGFETAAPQELLALLRQRIAAREEAAAADRVRDGIRVLGVKAILRQRWSQRPATREPRRRLSPRVACRNTWSRIETLRRNKRFVIAYRSRVSAFSWAWMPYFPRARTGSDASLVCPATRPHRARRPPDPPPPGWARFVARPASCGEERRGAYRR